MLTQAFATAPDKPGEPTDQLIRDILARHQNIPGNLLPVLHAIQDTFGHIPPTSVGMLSEALNRSRAEIHGVITFYAHFRQSPAAPNKLEICRAEACQAMGGDALAAHAVRTLGCDFKHVSQDKNTDLEPVYCLGLCAQSPAIALNGKPYARMTPAKLDQLLQTTQAADVKVTP